MEKIWCHKTIRSLDQKQKDEILEVVFDACTENDMCEDMGEIILHYLQRKKLLWEEEIED